MKGRQIKYSECELAWIKRRKAMARKSAHAKFVETFNRDDVSLNNFNALCKRKGWFTGRTGQYKKGRTPENKGKKMPFNPNSAATQFKKGHLPHNTNFIGHERISIDGYVEVSVAEINPHTGADRRYVLKHRHLWEIENGPVPTGMCLKCLDGNKLNCATENWECVPRSLLPRLNNRWGRSYDQVEAEVKPTVMAVAKLEDAIDNSKR